MYAPANSLHPVAFFTLAGVDDAQSDGRQIAGKWSDSPVELNFQTAGSLLAEFANWPKSDEAIVKFTRKYAPLQLPHRLDSVGRGASFQFSLDSWRDQQTRFQIGWRQYFTLCDVPISGKAISVGHDEVFVLTANGLKFKAANLLRLLMFGLDGMPVERLRICKRPDCTHPYFVARHLKQTLCSDECARWAQRNWKNQWWAAHGDEWRARRKARKSKRGKPRQR